MVTGGMETIRASVAANGNDVTPEKTTGFLDMDKIASVSGDDQSTQEPIRRLWTDEHEEQSRIRRENRERREKGAQVAEVRDFDLQEHLSSKQKSSSSSSKCIIM